MAPRTASRPTTWIALLRGINVGGNRMVPMAALRELFAELGYWDVQTHLQSGNVIFRAAAALKPATIAAACERAIDDRFKAPIRVILRTQRELRAVLKREPFPGADPSRVVVMFCAAAPRGRIDPARSPHDVAVIAGREIIIHCPRGQAGSKLTLAYLEKTLATTCTGRNWRTVTALAAWGAA